MGDKRNYKSTRTIFALLLLSLLFITGGFSYAFFEYIGKGNTANLIETGNMIFRYDENSSQGNGIQLVNALPMSDENGKTLQSAHQMFDFQVFTNILDTSLEYQIVAKKQADSNFNEHYVKIYLTEIKGNQEIPITSTIKPDGSVIRYSEFPETNFPNQTGKLIYRETMKNVAKYTKNFRLRMWIANDADASSDDYANKKFSIKVNVYAQSA